MKTTKLFKFKPTKELLAVLLSWVLVVAAFYTAFQVFTTKRVAGLFITFGVFGITLLGVLFPLVWNTIIKKRPLSALGIKKDKLLVSLGLCLAFSAVQYFLTLRTISLPGFKEIVPLITMAVAVALYENIFYRGWVQLRMEESFGIIPGIIISAAVYCLYHVGYGMPLNEFATLFVVGLVYSTIFRLTSNVFILFPFLTPMGAIFTQIKDGLTLPFAATYGFADVIMLCLVILYTVNKIYKKRNSPAAVKNPVLKPVCC